MTTTSVWATNKKYQWAKREQGSLLVVYHREQYLLLADETYRPGCAGSALQAETFEDALLEADTLHLPAGWVFVPQVQVWISKGWRVSKVVGKGEWRISDEDNEPRSQQIFFRPDLARAWCEIRNDRVGLNLRGPKPKGQLKESKS